jgi:hypothetical protein
MLEVWALDVSCWELGGRLLEIRCLNLFDLVYLVMLLPQLIMLARKVVASPVE